MTDYIRYAKNIRRLAEQLKNTNSSLEAAQIRARIAAERRIAYLTGNGNTAVSMPGIPGVTSPFSNFGNLLGFATDEQLKNVLNTINNNYKDIKTVLNMGVGEKAIGITGLKDCLTGKKVDVNNTPQFKPPPGWADPDTPPDLPFQDQQLTGKQWRRRMSGSGIGTCIQASRTPFPTLTAAIADDPVSSGPCYVSTDSIIQTNDNICGDGNVTGAAMVTYTTRTGGCTPSDPTISMPSYFIQQSCTPNGTTCPSVDVTTLPSTWPEDNIMQLSRGTDGKFKVSPHEPIADIVPSLSDNKHSTLDLCFDDGSGRKASIEPTYEGGYMVFERDPVTGEPIGRGQLFDKNNVLERHILVSEREFYLALGA